MTKDTWTKIRRLLSQAIKRTPSEGAKTGLPTGGTRWPGGPAP